MNRGGGACCCAHAARVAAIVPAPNSRPRRVSEILVMRFTALEATPSLVWVERNVVGGKREALALRSGCRRLVKRPRGLVRRQSVKDRLKHRQAHPLPDGGVAHVARRVLS